MPVTIRGLEKEINQANAEILQLQKELARERYEHQNTIKCTNAIDTAHRVTKAKLEQTMSLLTRSYEAMPVIAIVINCPISGKIRRVDYEEDDWEEICELISDLRAVSKEE